MKWIHRDWKHKEGERRVIKKFLFFPRNIAGDVRWLEVAFIKQVYTDKYRYIGKIWFDERFVEGGGGRGRNHRSHKDRLRLP